MGRAEGAREVRAEERLLGRRELLPFGEREHQEGRVHQVLGERDAAGHLVHLERDGGGGGVLEAAILSLQVRPDAKLQAQVDAAIDAMKSDTRGGNRNFEIAAAYYNATGKRDLIDKAVKAFEKIDSVDTELAERLVEQGILSYDDLSVMEITDLVNTIEGLTEEQAVEIVARAEIARMPEFKDHAIVDRAVSYVGGNATLFVYDDASSQFIRRSTNLKKENG